MNIVTLVQVFTRVTIGLAKYVDISLRLQLALMMLQFYTEEELDKEKLLWFGGKGSLWRVPVADFNTGYGFAFFYLDRN